MMYVLTVILLLADGTAIKWPDRPYADLATCDADLRRVFGQMADYPAVTVAALCVPTREA